MLSFFFLWKLCWVCENPQRSAVPELLISAHLAPVWVPTHFPSPINMPVDGLWLVDPCVCIVPIVWHPTLTHCSLDKLMIHSDPDQDKAQTWFRSDVINRGGWCCAILCAHSFASTLLINHQAVLYSALNPLVTINHFLLNSEQSQANHYKYYQWKQRDLKE